MMGIKFSNTLKENNNVYYNGIYNYRERYFHKSETNYL